MGQEKSSLKRSTLKFLLHIFYDFASKKRQEINFFVEICMMMYKNFLKKF